MTFLWIKVLAFSALIDMGAVLFTRAVGDRRILVGAFVTMTLALLNWAIILDVTKQDSGLVTPSVIGHVLGFVVGMKLPLHGRDDREPGVCERCHPTRGPGSQSSDPS